MTHVGLIGLGLIGGSLGQSLRKIRRGSKRSYRVLGWGRSWSHLRKAKSVRAVDAYSTDLEDVVSHSDIVVLCVPVQVIPTLAKKVIPFMKKGSILSDVGSVKGAIVQKIKPLLQNKKTISFVGSHPIAGSEKSGVKYADGALLKGAPCVMTTDSAKSQALRKVSKMWSDVGMHCFKMKSKEHDRILAFTSHLPHLISFSLMKVINTEARRNPRLLKIIGGSFRDMTRVAHSDPSLWRGIFQLNRQEVKAASAKFRKMMKVQP